MKSKQEVTNTAALSGPKSSPMKPMYGTNQPVLQIISLVTIFETKCHMFAQHFLQTNAPIVTIVLLPSAQSQFKINF